MLDAGSVFVTLGGKFNGTGFSRFDAAVRGSGAKATEFERLLAGSMSRSSRAMHAMGTAAGLGAAGGVALLGVELVNTVKTAGSFERQMRNVNSIAGLNERQFGALSRRVLELSGKVAQSPQTLANGLYDLVSSGFNAEQSMTILASSARAATAGLTDTATSTRAVAAVLNAYRLPASRAADVSDILFQTVNRGVVSFAELAQNIGDVLPFAAAMHVDLRQVGAALSTMTKEGISAPEAVTRLKQTIQQFIKPSEDMAKAIKSTGFESGEALIKHKGLQGALEAVIKTTDGSKRSIAGLFPDIRGLGGALALTGNNARAAHADLEGFQHVSGAAAAVFKEQSKAASFAEQRLAAYKQQAEIIVGNSLLPILAAQAGKLTHALAGAARDGSLEQFGQGLGHTLEDVIHFAGQIAPALLQIGQAGATAAGDLAPLVGAGAELIASLPPGALLALVGGFLAFQAATAVLPVVAAGLSDVALAFGLVTTAIGSGELAALPGLLLAEVNPVTALATGIAAAAAAFIYLSGTEKSEADAAHAVADAKHSEAAAMQEVRDQVLAAADATFAARHADEQAAEAKRRVAEAARRYGRDSQQYREALNAEHEAAARSTAQHEQLAKAKRAVADADARAAEQAQGRIKAARELLDTQLHDASKDFFNPSTPGAVTRAEYTDRVVAAWQRYNAQVQAAAKGSAQAALSEMQLTRVLNGQRLITDQHALSVAKLTDVYNHLPRDAKIQLATTSQPALAQIGDLVGALRGVPRQQVVNILAKADSAQSQIASLTAVLRGVPAQKVIRVLAATNDARAQLAAIRALAAGVPASKVLRILQQGGPDVLAKLRAIAAAQLPGKTQQIHGDASNVYGVFAQLAGTILSPIIQPIVSVVTGKRRAAGKHAGSGEDSIVGEGSRWQGAREAIVDRRTGAAVIVDQPTMMRLGPDHYVIPLDEHRSAAMGLMAALARDMGLTGYARGRRAPKASAAGKRRAHRPRKIPPTLRPQRLPLDELEQKVSATHAKLDADRSKIQSLPGQISSTEASIRDIERRSESTAKESANKAEDLRRAKKKLAAQNAELRKARADAERQKRALNGGKDGRGLEWRLKKAKEFQAALDRQTDLANLAQQEMSIADHQDDDGAFSAAQSRRTEALRELQRLLGLAKSVAGISPAYARRLQQEINQALIDQQDTGDAEPAAPGAAEAMMAAERERLSRINADIALAGLTDGLSDDTSAAQSLVDFLGGVLSEVQSDPAHRGGDDAIAEIAGQLKQAKDNLKSLTTGGTSNSNPDLQAQLDQANARAADAESRARISDQALTVFGGSGDIGAGGPNAYAAAGGVVVHQTINTLMPGDSATYRAVGEASVVGYGMQGVRRTPRGSIGP